ncbi:MAG: hypothetical protein WCP92_04225 [bacterium]
MDKNNEFEHRPLGFDYLDSEYRYPGYGFYDRKSSRFMPHQFRNAIKIKGMVPRILISKDAYEDTFQLVDIVQKEVGWLGTVEKSNNDFLIKEVFLFNQKSHSTTCTITEEGLGTWAMEMMNNRPDGMDVVNSIRFWGHSHVWMGTSASAQDDTQMDVFAKSCPEFFIRGIFNKSGRMEFTLYLYSAGIEVHDVEWSIYDPNPDTSRKEKWEKEVKEKVGDMTFFTQVFSGKDKKRKNIRSFMNTSLFPLSDKNTESFPFKNEEEPNNE